MKGPRIVHATLGSITLAGLTLAAPQDRVEIRAITPEQRKACLEHLRDKGKPPTDYLAQKFATYDVVLLGETHWIRESCELVVSALPTLHEAGIRVLATEFLRSRQNDQAQRLVSGHEFDEELALSLMRDLPWPTWGFQEYREILRAAWRVNRGLPAERQLRVLGMDSDWSQHAMWSGTMSDHEKFASNLEREKNMVRVLEAGVFETGSKALVHCGFAHTVTCQGVRLGTELTKRHKGKVFQVGLHQNLPGAPTENRLAAFLEELAKDAGAKPIGFDVIDSPLENLHDADTPSFAMVRPPTFGGFASGWIVLRPRAELHPCSWIPGFITEQNFEQANAVSVRAHWVKEGEAKTPAELDRALQGHFPARAPAK